MFTRMSEIQVLNDVSFNKLFADTLGDLNWEIVPAKVLTQDEIIEIKSKFGVKQIGTWTVRSVFGYESVVEYDNKTGCVEYKIIDPDFGSLMCIPSRMATGLDGNIRFELMVAATGDGLVYHLKVTTYSGKEVFGKYYVLSNIE